MSGKETSCEPRLIGCVHLVSIGVLILVAVQSVYRGMEEDNIWHEMDNLRGELRNLRQVVVSLQRREERVERQLRRERRQVGSGNRPEVLDYAYGAKLPETTSNLTIYNRWSSRAGQSDHTGVIDHHKVSAAWTGRDDINNLHLSQQSRDDIRNPRQAQQNKNDIGSSGLGQVLQQGVYRRSRVSSTGAGSHGVLIEVPGNILSGKQSHATNQVVVPRSPVQYTQRPITTPPSPITTPRPAPSSPSPTYKRPQLKSLGTPDRPTKEATAIQLEAGHQEVSKGDVHTHWKLARWARRLGAADSFPLSNGKVGVPTPGLYLVYAQISYVDKHKHQSFSIYVNSSPHLHCDQRRGLGMEMSCFTSGLLYLEQGDSVSVKDNRPGRRIDSTHGKTFFGLVKLTRDWI